MTLNEWIEKYNSKVPEKFVRDNRYELFYLPDKGFCEVGQDGELVIINQLCGDARFWKDKVSDMARKIGAKRCGTWCIRKEIKAYIRLFGYRIIEDIELPDGLSRYLVINKNDGKEGLVSPAFRYSTGEQAYFITWEP